LSHTAEEGGETPLLTPRGMRCLSAALLIIFLLITAGVLLLPGIFWDRFIYPYLWGPVLADAGLPSGGAVAGYNPVNTLFYGALLLVSLIYIHFIFVKLGIKMGNEFFLAISPVLLAGPLLRVLEDAGFFRAPASYLFISPLIYVYLGLTTLLAASLSKALLDSSHRWRVYLSAVPALITPALFLIFSIKGVLLAPPWPFALLMAAVAISPFLGRKIRWCFHHTLTLFSAAVLTTALLPVFLAPWEGWPTLPQLHPEVALFSLGGAALTALVLHALLKFFKVRFPGRAPHPTGINAAIIFGQALDALATAWAVECLGYTEKHVLPRLLFSSTGTAFSMVPLKVFLVVVVLYFLDVRMRVEGERYPTLLSIIRLSILVLGIGPGLRDVLRASVGL